MAGEFFQSQLGGYAPLATGQAFTPHLGFEGVPFLGGGGFGGMAAQFALGPMLQQMMGGVGMMPMGLHDQNVADIIENRRFTALYRQSMQEASAAERAGMMRTARGMAALTGTPFGARQRDAAGALADTIAPLMPMLAEMFPGVADDLGGMRGSPTAMAYQTAMAGRYRMDPITGRMGMSAESTSGLSKQMFRGLFEQGDITQMKGFGAGQIGSMFDELNRRGMIAGPEGTLASRTQNVVDELRLTSPAALQRAAGNVGVTLPAGGGAITAADLDKLKLDPAVADRLRSFDAEGIKRSLKSYASAVAAMRDIFGDMGQRNAPMAQLVAGLETMTQGSLSQIDPGRISQMVRQTYETAKLTGVPLDSALMMQQHAANRAQQLGIEPIFGVQAAAGGMAWAGAFRAGGGNATPAWGRFNADQQAQLDVNLRVQASDSRMANQIGLAERLGTTAGGFGKDTMAGRYLAAIRGGETEFDAGGGKMRSIAMDQDTFSRMLTTATDRNNQSLGISESMVSEMLTQRHENREGGMRVDAGGLVRRVQGREEFRPWVSARLGESISATLQGRGVSADDAQAAALRVSQRVTERMMGMSSGDFASNERRQSIVGQALQEELGGTAAGKAIAAAGGNQEAFYKTMAETAYGYTNQQMRYGPYSALGNLQQGHVQMSDETIRKGEQLAMQAGFNREAAEALTPLGRGSMLRRTIEGLQRADPKDPKAAQRVLAAAFGGVATSEVRARFEGPMKDLNSELTKLKEMETQIAGAEEGPAKKDLMKQRAAKKEAIDAQIAAMAKTGAELGFGGDETVTRQNALAAAESTVEAGQLVLDADTLRHDPRKFGKFWTSEKGAMARETLDKARLDLEDVVTKSVTSKESLARYGPEALKNYEKLTVGRKELQRLAYLHTGGDLAKLALGDLNIDRSTDAGNTEYNKVFGRVKQIQDQQTVMAEWYAARSGKDAKTWASMNPEAAAALEKSAETKTARADIEGSAAETAKELYKTFGFEGEEAAGDIAKAGGKMGDQAGKDAMKLLAQSQRVLQTAAKAQPLAPGADPNDPTSGVRKMTAQYIKSQSGEQWAWQRWAATDKFRKDYNLDTDKKWTEFEQAMQLHRTTGATEVTEGKPGMSADDRRKELQKVLDRVNQAKRIPLPGEPATRPEDAAAGGAASAKEGAQNITVSGRLTIVGGDQADLNAKSTGLPDVPAH